MAPLGNMCSPKRSLATFGQIMDHCNFLRKLISLLCLAEFVRFMYYMAICLFSYDLTMPREIFSVKMADFFAKKFSKA